MTQYTEPGAPKPPMSHRALDRIAHGPESARTMSTQNRYGQSELFTFVTVALILARNEPEVCGCPIVTSLDPMTQA